MREGLPECFPRLWRFCLSLTGRRDAADDLAQMTCARAIEKAQHFEPGTHLDRWLFVMARRLWLNELRRDSIRGSAGFVSADEIEISDNSAPMETNIFARQVLSELNRLPEAQRVAALLVFVEGCKYAEAAEILEIPIGTVMSRISAARVTLARRVAQATGTNE
ncbi:RNA polymerase sigma factor [uncultured Roseovarius sp.]|uniref:RNA polymerase sigma factor n=1 Tax=uncultured Roseovarius sp. TaxID=293344 RepID=UPI002638BB40|nr:RNA polymerase sigma factor [uncultured Roseovarius sp.]